VGHESFLEVVPQAEVDDGDRLHVPAEHAVLELHVEVRDTERV